MMQHLENFEGLQELTLPKSESKKHRTPAVSRRESFGAEAASTPASSTKRRGRPRGWTDARIQAILQYLQLNMTGYKNSPTAEFYTALCLSLGYDLSEVQEVQDKCEKMIKKYESDTRRNDVSWKWYARMNQVFGGPPIPAFGFRPVDDDAASSSMDSADEEFGEDGEPIPRRPRGEDPFQDRLEHEKLLLKLKKLKSKTEMRHREWEAGAAKQSAAFEELKTKTVSAIARLEKSIMNAGYELDQNEAATAEQPQQSAHGDLHI